MFRPASIFIGLRYTRAKKRSHFISFISLVSMLGIALGVMTLITVLSVMNGFDREIQKRVFSMVAPITISSITGSITDWSAVEKKVLKLPGVSGVAPFISGETLLSTGASVQPVLVTGILPQQEGSVTQLPQMIKAGQLNALVAQKFGIVLGQALADALDVAIGDKITLITPQASLTPAGIIPRYKRFTVVGIFNAGGGFGFDKNLAFIHLQDAQKLYNLGNNVTGLHINTPFVFQAPQLANKISAQLSSSALLSTWADQFGEFFHSVQMEKTMMFLILILIIAVAAFNLVASLMMAVNEKSADIAILRTLGATPFDVMVIFVVQGGLIGGIGTLVGTLAGILLAANVTTLVNHLQKLLNMQFLSSNVYFVDYLPSLIQASDIIKISSVALILSLLATIYPAWRAAKIDPVESLRYE